MSLVDALSVDRATGRTVIGSRGDIRAFLLSHQGRCYTYVLRRPGGEPFYVGKGKAYRLFGHETQANTSERSHKLNVIRSIWADGGTIVYEIDQFHDTEEAAHARERRLVEMLGRHDLGRGPLTNQTDGGEGTSNPSEQSREKHRLTLGGFAEDGSDRSTVNRFFLSLGEHDSIAVKPEAELKRIEAVTPHPSPRRWTRRQAVALAASAIANGIVLVPGCQVPRRMITNGVPSIIENGVSRDIAKSGLASVIPGSSPGEERFVLDRASIDCITSVVGREALERAGVLAGPD